MRILIVDDSQFIRAQLTHMLKEGQNEVDEARDGGVALKKFYEQKYDVVILDLLMPGLNGIDVLREIKTHNPNIPVIICSSIGSQQDYIEQVIKYGASDIITKPFKKEELMEALEHCMA